LSKVIVIEPDSNRNRPNGITAFMHCQRCVEEMPGDTSPSDWARLAVGLQADGTIQVWCERHQCNVAIFNYSVEEAH
jgi:hypothetical protein